MYLKIQEVILKSTVDDFFSYFKKEEKLILERKKKTDKLISMSLKSFRRAGHASLEAKHQLFCSNENPFDPLCTIGHCCFVEERRFIL
jgi:hypothetical protein